MTELTREQREAIETALRHLPGSEVDARYELTWILAGRLSEKAGADAEDAARYRWLRRQAVAVRNYASGNPNWEIGWALRGESFDAAVDAARTGGKA